MAFIRTHSVRISGIAAAIPRNSESNEDLANMPKESIDLLIKTTGIQSRRIAPRSLTTSEMCAAAAEKLLTELKWDRHEIDILILVTQTPDQPIPG